MTKLKIDDLEKITAEFKSKMTVREGGGRVKITVHLGTCGIAAGARKIMSVFIDEIEKSKVTDVILTTSGCAGLCSKEPIATIELINEAPIKYIELTEFKARKIFAEHVLKGKLVTEYALSVGSETIH